MKPYLLGYYSLKSSGIMLVYATNKDEAIKKLEAELYYLSQLTIHSLTLE